MEPIGEPSGRSVRLALVAVGILALLAIVAFASRSGFGDHASASPSPGYVSYAFTAFLVLFVLMIPVAIYAFLLQSREGPPPQQKSFAWRVIRNLAMLVFFGFIGYAIVYLKEHRRGFLGLDLSKIRARKPSAHGGTPAPKSFEPTFQWTVLWIAVAVIVVVGIYLYTQRRRKGAMKPLPIPEADVADDLAATIGIAIDDLEAEPDARRAVIAAYARMEAALARHGLRRRPSQTPLEYLRHVLLELTSRPEPVSRLTELFEQAKFSRREIDSGMKLDAIAALRSIRDDLQAATA
ncbi:MAG TPA: DUF4129 domain-containing protein [Gaiellaceae bacterium]|nr:DUF4129 domain-containing protein [Gaiellaceae bacterium]